MTHKPKQTAGDILDKVYIDFVVLGDRHLDPNESEDWLKQALLNNLLSAMPHYFASPDKDEYSRGFNEALDDVTKIIKEFFNG